MFKNFIHALEGMVDYYTSLEQEINDQYFEVNSFEILKERNYKMYKELIGDNYDSSYANPSFCNSQFGPNLGKLSSAIYADFRNLITYAFEHDIGGIQIFSQYLEELKALYSLETVSYDQIHKSYIAFRKKHIHKLVIEPRTMLFDPQESYSNKILKSANLSDLRYLFMLGQYISDNEIGTAKFLQKYNKDEVSGLAEMTVNAYIKGFSDDNKDISLRSNVEIVHNIGQEIMISKILEYFANNKLEGFYSQPETTNPNKQYSFDHKFDNSLYLDETYKNLYEEKMGEAFTAKSSIHNNYSGVMYYDKFGETPFSPDSKEGILKLSEEQTTLSMGLTTFRRQEIEKCMPENETSFCIIAFPTPEIGDNFEEIYEQTCLINKLDSSIYEPIHQVIIDALDQGTFIHVKGQHGNKTDIRVAMQKIQDTKKQTNYSNCGASVNIPVGEVFTSPQLQHTNGILHLDTVFLNDFKFNELELVFTDGMITSYSCANFDNDTDNKKFIEENLLFPHKTLPLGEFAIGTNTLAYTIAEEYDIVDILPVLIVEKMGPHFAIGDTCYSWCEDDPIYNPNGKEIMSRDNEYSLKRKDDVSKAYTNVHTDITLPYDSLAFIKAIKDNGEEISIIENGRFVLKGTEMLNEPFNK